MFTAALNVIQEITTEWVEIRTWDECPFKIEIAFLNLSTAYLGHRVEGKGREGKGGKQELKTGQTDSNFLQLNFSSSSALGACIDMYPVSSITLWDILYQEGRQNPTIPVISSLFSKLKAVL